MLEVTELWEILIPQWIGLDKDEKLDVKDWYREINKYVTGCTVINMHTSGFWGEEEETCKVVRLACDRITMERVMQHTKTLYEQESVMAYRISNTCLIG